MGTYNIYLYKSLCKATPRKCSAFLKIFFNPLTPRSFVGLSKTNLGWLQSEFAKTYFYYFSKWINLLQRDWKDPHRRQRPARFEQDFDQELHIFHLEQAIYRYQKQASLNDFWPAMVVFDVLVSDKE